MYKEEINIVFKILEKFKVAGLKKYRNNLDIKNLNNIDEVLEAILDPLCIMYRKVNLYETKFFNLNNYGLTYIARQNGNRVPVLLIPSTFGYKIYFSDTKKIKLLTKKIKEQIDLKVFIFHRPLPGNLFEVKNIIILITRLLRIKDIVPIAILSLFITLLGLVIPQTNKYILNTIIPMGPANETYYILLGVCLIFFTACIMSGLISVYKTFFLNKLKLRINSQIQSSIMSRILLMPQTYFARTSSGKLSTNLKYAQRLSENVLDILVDGSISAIFSLIYIPQMISFGPILSIPAIVFLIVQIIISFQLSFINVKNIRSRMRYDIETTNFAFSALKAIQKIQIAGAQENVIAKWYNSYKKLISHTLNPKLSIKLNTVILGTISGLSTIIVLTTAVLTGTSRADYIAFCSSFSLVGAAVQYVNSTFNTIIGMSPLLDRVKKILSLKEEAQHTQKYIQKLYGEINIDKLCFSYEGCKRKCLDNISLHIKKGEKIAIVGESGCGKSTLMKLLIGIEHAQSGKIEYDGQNLSKLNIRSVRKNISSIMQFSRIIPGTIYDNVMYLNANKTDKNLAEQAICKSGLKDFIDNLDMGMDTEITDTRTGGLSGGQRQRLLIARALASNNNIMIFDEATSALDNYTQKQILDSIFESKATVIMVAHRLSTVVNADKIYLINDGKICETGSYNELLKLNGKFAKLVEKQNNVLFG